MTEVSEVQRVVLTVWEHTLGIEGIRLTDDFFELGGDSITAIRMLPLISESIGVDIDPMFIFESPTPGELAADIVALLDAR